MSAISNMTSTTSTTNINFEVSLKGNLTIQKMDSSKQMDSSQYHIECDQLKHKLVVAVKFENEMKNRSPDDEMFLVKSLAEFHFKNVAFNLAVGLPIRERTVLRIEPTVRFSWDALPVSYHVIEDVSGDGQPFKTMLNMPDKRYTEAIKKELAQVIRKMTANTVLGKLMSITPQE